MISKSKALLVASLASAMAIPAMAGDKMDMMGKKAAGEKAKCYGVNKCKGTGDCGGPGGGSCHGSNACKRTGFIEMDKDTCLRIDGGRLTEKEEKADKPADKGMGK